MRIFLIIALLFLSEITKGQNIEVIKYVDLSEIISEESDNTKVINFWATWCGPCVKELPQFESLQKKFASKNTEVILVSFDFVEQLGKVEKFVQKKNLQSKIYLLDETDYNAFIDKIDPSWSGAIPATLILNNRSNKRAFFEQEFHEGELEKAFVQFTN